MPLSNGRIAVCVPTAGANGIRRGREIVGLAAEKDQIEGIAQRIGRDGRRCRPVDVAETAADHQSGLRQLSGALRPHEEDNIAAGRQQPAAEISADRPSTDHQNSHNHPAERDVTERRKPSP